jgi:ZIP family zinc transporter
VAALATAGGGGILLAAVALELVPEADARAGTAWTIAGLLAGAVLFVTADAWLARDKHAAHMRRAGHAAASGMTMPVDDPPPPPEPERGHDEEGARGESIAAGIVVDGVPESLALGLMAAEGASGFALLAAVVIGNLTEAYGAAQPIVASGRSRRYAVSLLSIIGLGLGTMTVLGGLAGSAIGDTLIGVAQAVAAGGVIAVVSISVAPYAFQEASRASALAITVGFALGYLLSS